MTAVHEHHARAPSRRQPLVLALGGRGTVGRVRNSAENAAKDRVHGH